MSTEDNSQPVAKKRKEDKRKKTRPYDLSYLKFGFIQCPSNSTRPMCLLCGNSLTNESMKPCRLREHLHKMHPNKIDADFTKMKAEREKQASIKSLFNKRGTRLEKGLLASYKISLLIAKAGKPHSIGERLILPAVKEVIETVMDQSSSAVLSAVSLSNDTVQRRIDEMADDVKKQLTDILSSTKHSLQVDESTLRDNEALLLGYVRFVYKGESKEEMLFSISLPTDTRASTIFEAIKQFYKTNTIPLNNIIQCATDGAPAMLGKHRGFIALMKREIPGLIVIHCVLHRHHLATKNLSTELHETLDFVIKCINRIKAKSLNDRLFHQPCRDNDEDFERLLLHTEVRWLSKGACLNRIYDLYDTVLEFLRKSDEEFASRFEGLKNDIAYLSDIFRILSESNKKLQGNQMTLVKCKSVLTSFIAKLGQFKNNIGRGQLSQFPNLSENKVTEEERMKYSSHLENLKAEMTERFADLLDLNVPNWVLRPLTCDIDKDVPIELQEDIIDLRSDDAIKASFSDENYCALWCYVSAKFPTLWRSAMIYILSFPTSYLVEQGFSAVVEILTKKRNRLAISERGDLRLFLTKLSPDIQSLTLQPQAQPSH